jgi:hypothetical protein
LLREAEKKVVASFLVLYKAAFPSTHLDREKELNFVEKKEQKRKSTKQRRINSYQKA